MLFLGWREAILFIVNGQENRRRKDKIKKDKYKDPCPTSMIKLGHFALHDCREIGGQTLCILSSTRKGASVETTICIFPPPYLPTY